MKSLAYLNKYFIKYKWRLLLGILFIIATNIFQVSKPLFFTQKFGSLDNLSSQELENVTGYALKLGLYYIVLAAIAGFFLFLTRQTIIIMSRHIEYDLKNEVYNQYQRLGYTFFKKNATGDLMNRIAEDVTHVRSYLGPGLMYTINLFFLSIILISVMANINGVLTVIVLIPLPIMSFLIYKGSSKMNQLSRKVQEEQSYMSTLAQEYFSGIRVIKAYSRDDEVKGKFDDSAEEYKRRSMRLVLVNSLFIPTIFILIGLSTLLSIYVGGILVHEGTEQFKFEHIVMFIICVNMLTWPFASVGWVTSIIQRAAASQARINEFLNENPEIVNTSSEKFDFQGNIEFRNVSYTYRNSGLTAIKNLSFTIKPGETLGIVGRTGSGKSTVLNLLMRQIDPDEGEILIDGKPLKEINLEAFRDQTGIVPQDVFLFSDTIRNNLAFGSTQEVTQEKLENAVKMSHVYHNIIDFKDGFDTILGERGVNLSGGQKQRISIARALIRQPKLLVLDDCLSAVDTETEEIIIRNLQSANYTSSVVVSHRISTIRHADRIISINEGQKTEEGTHEQLMELNGHYAELYTKQLTEESLDFE